jgi:hypothetical protein
MRERMRLFLTAASLLSLPVVVMAQQTGTKTGVAGHRDLASWDLNKPEERRVSSRSLGYVSVYFSLYPDTMALCFWRTSSVYICF